MLCIAFDSNISNTSSAGYRGFFWEIKGFVSIGQNYRGHESVRDKRRVVNTNFVFDKLQKNSRHRVKE